MARARNLKPQFFKDAKVVACSYPARLLFQGLWCLADYMGRLKYVPIEIKMEVFPADDVSVEDLMQELSINGLIEIYNDCSGAALVQVLGFSKHQNPHINEKVGRDKKPLPHLPGKEECKSAEDKESVEKNTPEQLVTDAIGVILEHYQSVPADSLFPLTDSLFPLAGSSSSQQPDGSDKPKKFSAKLIPLPAAINGTAWLEWCDYRSSVRKPISEKAAARQIEMLSQHDFETQAAMINESITNDYQGIFPLKGGQNATGQSTASRRSESASKYHDFDKATDF